MDRGRPGHEFYHFFKDANNRYQTASYNGLGYPTIISNQSPYPLKNPPANFKDIKVTIGTNKTYQSLVRSVTLMFQFTEDGADILREFDMNRGGYAAELYYIIIRWDSTFGSSGAFRLYYEGRFDFKKKKDNPITGFSIPCVDTSIWGILSQNDTVQYPIDCTPQNPLTIPVLLDGITLAAKFTYQPVNQTFFINNLDGTHNYPFVAPLVLVASDGDSSGAITQNENFAIIDSLATTYFVKNNANFFYKTSKAQQVHITGTLQFQFKMGGSGQVPLRIVISDFFADIYSTDILVKDLSLIVDGSFHTYTVNIDAIVDLLSGETLALSFINLFPNLDGFYYLFDITNIYVSLKSKADVSITRALRPLDLLQEIVKRATNGQYTANSNFFTQNNKLVCTAGNSIRIAPNAYIKASFQDWFKSYDSKYWLAFRIINNQIWVEPFTTIYDDTTNLMVLPEVSKVEIEDALDYLFNEIEVGSPKQDYRHTSGRLEFNGTNKFSIYQFNIKQKLDLKSIFRKDGYGVEFIRLDYQQQSSVDNSGDDSVLMLDITDEKQTDGVEVENFANVTVNNEPLSPIIYTPFSNDTISNNKPTLKGVCQPSTTVHIYVDNTLDGSAVSDVNGNWSYDIQTALTAYVVGVTDGIHTIDATFTDETGTLSTITVFITTGSTPVSIDIDDNLYNNKPLIKGFAQAGTVVNVSIDGISIGNTTADGSCRWQIQSPRMSNGVHTILANGASKTVNVNSFVSTPLITSFSDGFQIVNNAPLVQGVAEAGTFVTLWSNYYPDVPLGSATTDAFGNWSIQLVPLFKIDGITPLVPLPNGLNILSTSLEIKSAIVSITGYKLNRPAYSSVEGVIDNTVFNTRLTPKLDLIARMRFFKSVFFQQPHTVIVFESGDKNQAFATTLDGVTVRERDDLHIDQYSDSAVFLPIIFNCKVQAPFFFVDIMKNFSSGGLVVLPYNGLEIYCLPIGEMSVEDVTNDVQSWKLLVSAKTPLLTLLKLSTSGSNFTTMENAIFRSDYNTLHFVQYNNEANPKYKNVTIYEDLWCKRNEAWIENPKYLQKIQTTDPCRDQIITNGVSGTIILNSYDLYSGKLIHTYNYAAVAPAPIPFPDVVQEVTIDWSDYSEGDFVLIMFVSGVPVAISEPVSIAVDHPKTVLIESTNSKNKTGAMFSTGFGFNFRVEGMLKKLQPDVESIINEDDSGDFDNIHSINTRKRTLIVGNGFGLPDYVYLKIMPGLALDKVLLDGQEHVLSKNAKFEPVDQTAGHPMYYYYIDMELKDNSLATLIPSQQGNLVGSVILVADAGAFGMGGGGFINIELKEN